MFVERIYWCGGGTTSVAHVGILQALEEQGLLISVREMLGISAGAMFALALSIGYTFEEIRHIYLTFDFSNVTEPLPGPDCLTNLSLDSGKNLLAFVEALLHVKGHDRRITFGNLPSRYALRVFATDLNDCEFVEFSAAKTPHFVVADAVAASMSLPLIFKPVIDSRNGNSLVDGATISNLPFSFIPQNEIQTLLSVSFDTRPVPKKNLEIQDYLTRPMALIINSRTEREIDLNKNRVIRVDVRGHLPVDWEMSTEIREELISKGYAAAKKWLRTYRKSILRRFSVS